MHPVLSRTRKQVVISGTSYVTLTSNDYLGLAQDPGLVRVATGVLQGQGMGSGGSRLLGGDTGLAHDLEHVLARGIGLSAALVWASGYQSNLGIVSTLAGAEDMVFVDRLIHASWIDGIRLSGVRFQRFRHNDAAHLETLLQRYRGKYRRAIVIVESLYSMDGDLCPLLDMLQVQQANDALLIIDEAHAFGVYGTHGFGCWSGLGKPVTDAVFVVGTFGKAAGSYGAFVACDAAWRETFIQSARSFIYSTALPLPVLAWNHAFVTRLPRYQGLRETLQQNVTFFRESLQDLPLMGAHMVVPVSLSEAQADAVVSTVREAGFWVSCVRYPTVPKGEARLRLSLCADHEPADLQRLAEVLRCTCA